MNRIMYRPSDDSMPWHLLHPNKMNNRHLFEGELLFDWAFDSDYDVKMAEPVLISPIPHDDTRWHRFCSNEAVLFLFGKGCEITSSSRLTAGGNSLVKPLYDFFTGVIPYTNNARHMNRRFKLANLTSALRWLGVTSAQGRVLSDSQVSNCIRKSVLGIGPAYTKEGYKGKNFKSYEHTYQPKQLTFHTLFHKP